jgi:hypothetical protein
MPNYAVHDGTTVLNVIVAESMEIAEGATNLTAVETTGVPWIGWTLYGEEWRPPQPYPSWEWADGAWTAPTPQPTDGGLYIWDEDTLSWVALDPPA